MKTCPKCGYEDDPFWLNHQWQQHIEYCRVEDFREHYPTLALQLSKSGSLTSDISFYYRLTNRGTFVYRWAKKLGPKAYHLDYEAARKKGFVYIPQNQTTLEVESVEACDLDQEEQERKLRLITNLGIENIVGIDLAGVKHQKTGFATLRGLEAKTEVLHSDRAILKAVDKNKPSIVSIDAPLGKPVKGYMRVCERQLKKMKINVFPCMFTQMAKLTERGIKLAELLRKKSYLVIESYPGSAQDILGIPRKGKSLQALQEGLVKFGITGDVLKYKVTDHELDAITSAIVGKLYFENKTISIGNKEEGLMVIPKPRDCF